MKTKEGTPDETNIEAFPDQDGVPTKRSGDRKRAAGTSKRNDLINKTSREVPDADSTIADLNHEDSCSDH